jgi:hypothetical protein
MYRNLLTKKFFKTIHIQKTQHSGLSTAHFYTMVLIRLRLSLL